MLENRNHTIGGGERGMVDYLRLKSSDCKNCYKCIRSCPVKSIRFSEHKAQIIDTECILCGQCFVVCPQHAKQIRDDTEVARQLIASGEQVIASIAPSFVAAFDDVTIESMRSALKKLGFADAEETAVGAAIVTAEYEKLVDSGSQQVIISTCCHSVNLLVQKHYPKALPYLAHVLSPMLAHGQDIKRRHRDAKTVFIGPCISKKDEAETYPGYIDCVLTFADLSAWLEKEGISLEYERDDKQEGRTRIYPTTGGVIKSMGHQNNGYAYLSVDGTESCKQVLEDVCQGRLGKCFIEMSACVGSCIGGPAVGKNRRNPAREYLAVHDYAKETPIPVEEYAESEMKKEMPALAPRKVFIGDEAIAEVLKKIGKTKPEHELNCGGCGYNTCREKAIAVLMGKADLNMCLPYLKEKAESFSDTIINNTPNAIIALNEVCEVQQINTAACKLMNIRSPKDVLGDQVVRILDPFPFMQVFQTGKDIYNKRVYLAEYKKYVEQSIIYDGSSHAIICIMRDVTEEAQQEKNKEQLMRTTIEITDKVIQKQMMTVQEIASLLGETTAETKVALTKLKESLKND